MYLSWQKLHVLLSGGMHLQAGMTRAHEIIKDLAEVDQQLEDLASEELVLETRKTVLLAERRRLKKEKKQIEGRRESARAAGEHNVAVGGYDSHSE